MNQKRWFKIEQNMTKWSVVNEKGGNTPSILDENLWGCQFDFGHNNLMLKWRALNRIKAFDGIKCSQFSYVQQNTIVNGYRLTGNTRLWYVIIIWSHCLMTFFPQTFWNVISHAKHTPHSLLKNEIWLRNLW